MSRHSNPTTIGAFVIGAIVLIAGGFAIFGGSQIFADKIRYVALFDEPTNGLRVGANVMLNGVRIGYVSDIVLLIDEGTFDTETQVTMEILTEDYIMTSSGTPIDSEMTSFIDHTALVDWAGLRATLEIESFVTGQLRIELQFRPETEPVMRAIDPPYPEIPTITSNIQAMLDKVQNWLTDLQENVDIPALATQLSSVLTGLDELVHSQDVRESLAGINTLVNDRNTQDIGSTMQAALEELREASQSARSMFDDAGESVDTLLAEARPVLKSLDAALIHAEQTLAIAKKQLSGDSEQFYQLDTTIEELERAARSIREFFDYIERNPEALIRGKQ